MASGCGQPIPGLYNGVLRPPVIARTVASFGDRIRPAQHHFRQWTPQCLERLFFTTKSDCHVPSSGERAPHAQTMPTKYGLIRRVLHLHNLLPNRLPHRPRRVQRLALPITTRVSGGSGRMGGGRTGSRNYTDGDGSGNNKSSAKTRYSGPLIRWKEVLAHIQTLEGGLTVGV